MKLHSILAKHSEALMFLSQKKGEFNHFYNSKAIMQCEKEKWPDNNESCENCIMGRGPNPTLCKQFATNVTYDGEKKGYMLCYGKHSLKSIILTMAPLNYLHVSWTYSFAVLLLVSFC